MINKFITSKHISQDKLRALQIMQEHFMNIKNGFANDKSCTAPILLITGSPGTGKSWLIQIITEFGELF
jgi:DNA replication protein DnaC